MLTIKIVAVGTLKEKFYVDAVAEYVKRLSKYCKLEIIQVKESDIKKECEEIRDKLKGHVILCDLRGELVSSEGFAQKIEKLQMATSTISIVIGGSEGVGNYLDDVIDEWMSFGKITLPHQLFRVVLVEQIYRAFTILKGEKYHK